MMIKKPLLIREKAMFEYLDSRRPRRALLIGMGLPGITTEEAKASLEELAQLAYTAEVEVCDTLLQTRNRVDPTYYIGKGKAAELDSLASGHDVDLLIFDNDLSPAQMRNLEELTGQRILDRSLLILDIFARHAHSRVAQLQVEKAQLNYLLPRLTRQWKHLSRQAGGKAGVRGPGETQLESDRRNLRQRLGGLAQNLQQVRRQMATSRKSRKEVFKVTLVGYTNSGKSTLMRAISGAEVLIQDQLFATLDSTTRTVALDSQRKMLLTDTVGFINRLPHHLFESFRATLEEAVNADLLLHVVDRSHPHYEDQIETAEEVLKELGLEEKPTLIVYNKTDRLDAKQRQEVARACAEMENAVVISAHTGEGVEELQEEIRAFHPLDSVELDLRIPQTEGRLLSQLRAHGEILDQDFRENDACLRVRLDRRWIGSLHLDRFAVEENAAEPLQTV
ncbi:MAG: GTPase HflX [Gemmatimonadetes bacterium]|nr:GTPase HflX [Gemmatimonadota bacterium]